MSYQKHLFFCTNQRPVGQRCCFHSNSDQLRLYAKAKLQDLNLLGPGKVRVNIAGCLGRCALGPTLVVYPEGTWYHYESEQDLDEIIEQHICNDKIVTRLVMPPMQAEA